MFIILFIGTPFLIISIICLYKFCKDKTTDFDAEATFFGGLFIATIITVCCVTGGYYFSFIEKEEALVTTAKQLQIGEERLEYLTKVTEKNLVQKYPALEKEIFQTIGLQKTSQLLAYYAAYPQLKSSDALIKAVANMESYYDYVIKLRNYAETIKMEMRVIKRNPWLFSVFIPEPPK